MHVVMNRKSQNIQRHKWNCAFLHTTVYSVILTSVVAMPASVSSTIDPLPVPADKLRPPPAPAFPTAAPPAPRYPLYPYIDIPRPPRNPCARMEGDVSEHCSTSADFMKLHSIIHLACSYPLIYFHH